MLGPALKLLFENLDGRQDELTAYEEVLHTELLALQAKDPRRSEGEFGGVGKRSRPHRSAPKIGRRGRLGHGFPEAEGAGGGEAFNLEVELSSGSGVPQLQINCNQSNCPNKKRK
jgi:hypothetical protein